MGILILLTSPRPSAVGGGGGGGREVEGLYPPTVKEMIKRVQEIIHCENTKKQKQIKELNET